MKWAIGILVLCQIVAVTLRFLCIVQNNNYKLTVSKKAVSFFAVNTVLLLPTLFMGLFLGNSVADNVIEAMYAAVSVLTAFYLSLGYRTQPKYTFRAKTVLIFSLSAAVLAVVACCCAVRDKGFSIMACAISGIVAPLFTILAALALNPYFERKNDKFIAENCRKLQESNAIKIGITGSYGKTGCKNILRAMLERKYTVVCTDKNYNTPMGIALTAERMTGREEIFIAEMGARRRGDISYLSELVRPDYSLTTGVCCQHLATFKSLHNIFLEKSELYKHTKLVSVFNCNDKYALKMYKECKGKKIKVCSNKEGDVYATDIVSDCNGSTFKLVYNDIVLSAQTKLLGRHNVINIALCAALALELKVEPEVICDVISALKPTPHRLEYIYSNGIYILDDSYNSNPLGVRCALEVLGSFENRKIILSQGLVEGGKMDAALNRSVGKEIAPKVDVAILCGKNAKYLAEGLKEGGYSGQIYRYRDLKRAQAHFKEILQSGDVLLLQNDLPDVY